MGSDDETKDEPTGQILEPLWDANQAAKFMGVSRSWIHQRVEAGLLPRIRVGGLVRFEPEATRKFLRHDRVGASTALARVRFGRR
ncbi:MAG: helix-turn-helix domain-containing protein [Deltaproteobacteria bacterium]|nr:helix-turn-helix domain-containing protein [Deltaproteobacteria bacterium]